MAPLNDWRGFVLFLTGFENSLLRLNRVQVRQVWRQIFQCASLAFNEDCGGGRCMEGDIVPEHSLRGISALVGASVQVRC